MRVQERFDVADIDDGPVGLPRRVVRNSVKSRRAVKRASSVACPRGWVPVRRARSRPATRCSANPITAGCSGAGTALMRDCRRLAARRSSRSGGSANLLAEEVLEGPREGQVGGDSVQ
ncbi:hypothetical protein MLGJGCBP_07885 [Rhodococcus sp. T7]|nr:hypothetical protein MLGJGCBP_09000 [Rhodococcus sp. T7]KAF0959008.1 hypothetical protein MLGJGCBP_07885 [Rhodococcus sp. T7]